MKKFSHNKPMSSLVKHKTRNPDIRWKSGKIRHPDIVVCMGFDKVQCTIKIAIKIDLRIYLRRMNNLYEDQSNTPINLIANH